MFGIIKGKPLLYVMHTIMPGQMAFSFMRSYLFRAFYLGNKRGIRMTILVGVIMGSKSDWETMKHACEVLDQFEIAYEKKVVSAHRTPDLMFTYAKEARERGLKVIIAGAGGAAHLPGMVAAKPPCQ